MTAEEHARLQQSKADRSWERYHEGWPDLVDRYDVTVALVRGPAVLDIGCAQGLLAYLMRQRRPDVARIAGVDAWSLMLEEARDRVGDLAEWHKAEAECLPFAAGEFDTVVMGQVLEHVYGLKAAANEALRVLRRGGRLIVNAPADDYEPGGLHVRVFRSVEALMDVFGEAMTWAGWGKVHRFWFAWGERK